MELSSWARKKLFWSIDSLKGRKVASHYHDLVTIGNKSADENSIELEKRLASILKYATEKVPFYREFKGAGLTDFPLLDKNLIKGNLDSFFANGYSPRNSIPAVTSGSTGTPFKTYQDFGKKYRNSADTIFFAEKGGFDFGCRLYYFKIWSDLNRKSALLRTAQNIEAVDVLTLEEKSREIFNRILRDKKNKHFLGYSSAIETLCRFLEKNPEYTGQLKVSSVITMSESLNEYTKVIGEKLFGCPVLSRYSNIENGILAQQTLINPKDFTINTASYKIEILDQFSNEPVKEGELGRIVVTDYFNHAMPLIRYDTGDLGIMELRSGQKSYWVLSEIEGRKLDQIFNTQGELVSSYIVYKNMWKYTELDQYQLIQLSSNEYKMKVSIKGDFKRENELINEFKHYLGDDAIFTVEYVSEIPLLSSGKRKKVLNLMNN
jgi:phenylacetate-CoA ligase